MRYIHTMLVTSDLGRTRTFLEALGYELMREIPHIRDGVQEATNYFFRLPGDTTDVEVSVPIESRITAGGWGHVALGVDDIDAALVRLAEHGIRPDATPYRVREGGPRLCLLTEPAAGHLFELVEIG